MQKSRILIWLITIALISSAFLTGCPPSGSQTPAIPLQLFEQAALQKEIAQLTALDDSSRTLLLASEEDKADGKKKEQEEEDEHRSSTTASETSRSAAASETSSSNINNANGNTSNSNSNTGFIASKAFAAAERKTRKNKHFI